MLLFQKRFHEGLVRGDVTVTLRRWDKPHVKVGGRYRCHPIGVLVVDRIERVRAREVTEDDAQRSGFGSRRELLAYVRNATGEPLRATSWLWRVELHHGGEEDRVEIALDDALSAEDVDAIRQRLERFDAQRAWTKETLAIIARRPRTAASKLAWSLGRETLELKTDIRKLKRLGLTQSFEVGYELSPRGRAFLAASKRKRKKRPS